MVTVPTNQGRRRMEVNFFDIFGPAPSIRRLKPKKPIIAEATSAPATATAPAVVTGPPTEAPGRATGRAQVRPLVRAPARTTGRAPGNALVRTSDGAPGGAPVLLPALPDPLPGAPPGPPPQSPTAASATAQASDTKTASDWTAEQDAQLLELKAKNASWKFISGVIEGKGGIQGLKDRFRELNKDSDEQSKSGETDGETDKEENGKKGEDGKGKKGKDGKGKKGEDGKGKGISEGKAAEAEKGEDDGKKEKNGKGKGKEKQDEKENEAVDRIVYVDEGDDFTIRELIYMYKLAERYEEEKWLKVASRFFDKTGKRVEPEYIAEKFGGAL